MHVTLQPMAVMIEAEARALVGFSPKRWNAARRDGFIVDVQGRFPVVNTVRGALAFERAKAQRQMAKTVFANAKGD